MGVALALGVYEPLSTLERTLVKFTFVAKSLVECPRSESGQKNHGPCPFGKGVACE